MTNSTIPVLDRREAYAALVEPKMKELWDLCKRYDVPLLALSIAYSDPEKEECHLRTSQIVPKNPRHMPDILFAVMEMLDDPDLVAAVIQIITLKAAFGADFRKVSAAELAPGSDTPN